MSSHASPSVADIGDRHRRLTALSLLFLGLIYTTDAAGYLLGPDAAGWLHLVEITAAVLTLLCLTPMVFWKIRNRDRSIWQAYAGEGGVVMDIVNRAKTVSWVVTFLVLVFLDQVAERRTDVPPEVFLATGLAVMVFTFSLAFLILDRDPGEPAVEEAPRA